MTRLRPRIVSRDPYNAETVSRALRRTRTPADALFVRNHGSVPSPTHEWAINVRGPGGVDTRFDLASLRLLPSRTVRMVLECAGNGRSGMEPTPPGVAWGEDAVGCVEFRGVSLRHLLRKARLGTTKGELVFTGGDQDAAGVTFERSLPSAKAMDVDTLVAYELNGRPLSPNHGGPVRLVVPGWFGVASVKWLRSIEASRKPFKGAYQAKHYWYRYKEERRRNRPVRELLVKSNIVAPSADKPLRVGHRVRIWGWAWGEDQVRRVDVSMDAGETWTKAKLGPQEGKYAWREWSTTWTPSAVGRTQILTRAVDARGTTQPIDPVWNHQGYGNNAAARRSVELVGRRGRANDRPSSATGLMRQDRVLVAPRKTM